MSRDKNNGTKKTTDKCYNNNNTKSKLKDKLFLARKSLVQEMYDVKHIRNIHYIFMMSLLALCINHIVDWLVHDGRISLPMSIDPIMPIIFDGPVVFLAWFIIFSATLLVYPVFQVWANVHKQMTIPILKKSWDILWIAIVLGYYYKVFAWAGDYVIENKLTLASSYALTLETTRFLMKTHAFIRENATKVLRDKQDFKMAPKFHYLQFLFMPTLVYRESYPRTKSINWINVVIFASEMCASMLFILYLYNMYFAGECTHLKVGTHFQLKEFAWLIFRNTVPSLGIMILMFYFYLDLFQNLFGELTRFADRQFYQDWWNSTSYDEYYRKWNGIVHDWLYSYIYKDAFDTFALKSTLAPKFLVFLLSAIVHEYILYHVMGYFFPVLGTIFLTFGMIFTLFRNPKFWLFNVLFLYSYALGLSITFTSYLIEYCVRQNPCAADSPKVPFDWLYSKTLFNECH